MSRWQERKDDTVELRVRYLEDDLDRIDISYTTFSSSLQVEVDSIRTEIERVKSRINAVLSTVAGASILLAVNVIVEAAK
jgi:archaellum component FlaC